MQHLFLHQIRGDVLDRPTGDNGDIAHQWPAVSLRQLVGDLSDRHAAPQGILACLNFLTEACEIRVVLENGLVPDQVLRFQIAGNARQAFTGFDLKSDLRAVMRVHRIDVCFAHFSPGVGQEPQRQDQGADPDQNRPEDMPKPGIPEYTVLALFVQAVIGIILISLMSGHVFPHCRPGRSMLRPAAFVSMPNMSAIVCCSLISASR